MIKLEFNNAKVSDNGFGLKVNGKYLEEIISTALGTRVDSNYGAGDGLNEFKSNCCNVTVIIDPQPVTTHIEDNVYEYASVEDMEADKREQFKKNAEKHPEE